MSPSLYPSEKKYSLAEATHIHNPNRQDNPLTLRVMRRRQRPLIAFAALLLLMYGMWQWRPLSAADSLQQLQGDPQNAAHGDSAKSAEAGGVQIANAKDQQTLAPSNAHVAEKRVPLEIHIMSKCPDAEMCLNDMILPTMMRVGNKVDFKLSFIGQPTEDDGGVDCMHGPTECIGNIIELCAFELYQDPKISLGFTMCITRDYPHIPERSLVEDCALEHGMDFQALNECTTREDGAHGISMLRRSVEETKAVSLNNIVHASFFFNFYNPRHEIISYIRSYPSTNADDVLCVS
ncbi:hypothetical protein Cpir12675_001373 [Ceratocystis pirilliformis]|uniref:Gamma interferon inducible lysosomal thiol reductase (GILT) n=1 Tax=Ceratocystis pirilliformis TaxID=259994 RepID=A0ABR3ZGS8_9PEZI